MRKKGRTKKNATFSLDIELADDKRVNSKMVNALVKNEVKKLNDGK